MGIDIGVVGLILSLQVGDELQEGGGIEIELIVHEGNLIEQLIGEVHLLEEDGIETHLLPEALTVVVSHAQGRVLLLVPPLKGDEDDMIEKRLTRSRKLTADFYHPFSHISLFS